MAITKNTIKTIKTNEAVIICYHAASAGTYRVGSEIYFSVKQLSPSLSTSNFKALSPGRAGKREKKKKNKKNYKKKNNNNRAAAGSVGFPSPPPDVPSVNSELPLRRVEFREV